MEQTLPTFPTTEQPERASDPRASDPRDFYAPDSPVQDDSGQVRQDFDPEAQDDDQVERIIAYHVWFP